MGSAITSNKPIRLFVTDIDGCLSEPYRPYRLDRIAVLKELLPTQVRPQDGAPPLTVCSGRSFPYVEAVTQMLGTACPVIFEAGGGMFDPVAGRWTWHPDFTDEVSRQVEEIRRWLDTDIRPGTSMDIDHAKVTQASLAGPIAREVNDAIPGVVARVQRDYPDMIVAHTHISIDVVPKVLNKAGGMRWLADVRKISLEEIAFIGDTNGDLPALEIVGYAFAPANATEPVREVAHITTRGAVIDGVIEAYRWCTDRNDHLINEAG